MTRNSALIAFAAAAMLSTPALAQNAAPGADPILLQDTAGNCENGLAFTHVLTNEPLVVLKPETEITPALEQFHCTGENAYDGDEAAIAEGKTLFRLCASCHGPNGEGRIGPSLIDENVKYERVATEHGEFEVIYGGAAGAMQPMGRRFEQDQILKIMAYIETLGGT